MEIEILDDLEILARPQLDLPDLKLSGVGFGSHALHSIERHLVTQVTLAPIVASLSVEPNGKTRYFGPDGERLLLGDVIDSVLAGSGILHYARGIGYKVESGTVVGFALSGPGHGYLGHFSRLRSYEEFLLTFGAPDLQLEDLQFGELLGYRNYYWRARKQAYWQCMSNQLTLVNIGDYDGNTGPQK